MPKGIVSINRGKSSAGYFLDSRSPIRSRTSFAGMTDVYCIMTDTYSISSFPRKRESPAAGLPLLIEMVPSNFSHLFSTITGRPISSDRGRMVRPFSLMPENIRSISFNQ